MKFTPHGIGRDKQTVTYDTVKDHIIQTVQRNYKHGLDVAKSLRNEAITDLKDVLPARALSTKADETAKSLEQTGHDIMYQEELKRYLERKEDLEENLTKAYALIFSQYIVTRLCNRELRNIKITSQSSGTTR
jgi:hypothetical protein